MGLTGAMVPSTHEPVEFTTQDGDLLVSSHGLLDFDSRCLLGSLGAFGLALLQQGSHLVGL